MAIQAVLSHRKVMITEEVKDSCRRSLMFLAAFLAVASVKTFPFGYRGISEKLLDEAFGSFEASNSASPIWVGDFSTSFFGPHSF